MVNESTEGFVVNSTFEIEAMDFPKLLYHNLFLALYQKYAFCGRRRSMTISASIPLPNTITYLLFILRSIWTGRGLLIALQLAVLFMALIHCFVRVWSFCSTQLNMSIGVVDPRTRHCRGGGWNATRLCPIVRRVLSLQRPLEWHFSTCDSIVGSELCML